MGSGSIRLDSPNWCSDQHGARHLPRRHVEPDGGWGPSKRITPSSGLAMQNGTNPGPGPDVGREMHVEHRLRAKPLGAVGLWRALHGRLGARDAPGSTMAGELPPGRSGRGEPKLHLPLTLDAENLSLA